MPIIHVETIHIAVGFDNFEFKRLINNEVRVFDKICQSGMRIFSNNKLAIKTKIQCPLFTWKLLISGWVLMIQTFASLFARRHGRRRRLRELKTLQEEVNLFDKAHLKSLKRHFEEVKGESTFNPLDY